MPMRRKNFHRISITKQSQSDSRHVWSLDLFDGNFVGWVFLFPTLTLQARAHILGNSNWAITKWLLSDGVNSWKKA